MADLRTAPAARRDIRDIGAYSRNAFGPDQARAYLDGLSAAFDRLAGRPLVGASEHDLGDGIRSVAYRGHRIYYRLDGNDLLIVRILHHSRDVGAAFGRNQ